MKSGILPVLCAGALLLAWGCGSRESVIPEAKWEKYKLPIDGLYVTGVAVESGVDGEVNARQKAYNDALKKLPEDVQAKIKEGVYGLFEQDSVVSGKEIDEIWYVGVKVLYRLKKINP